MRDTARGELPTAVSLLEPGLVPWDSTSVGESGVSILELEPAWNIILSTGQGSSCMPAQLQSFQQTFLMLWLRIEPELLGRLGFPRFPINLIRLSFSDSKLFNQPLKDAEFLLRC
ncbi:MAG: hypothetical protein B9J98_08355 [Candidatus Terraquivivens tikiterensis]|uniref:Uncharacterized protein n=1 Tax=Candidatus Terraquivivens tikiterensis TaxID=1980982 RepID=A0A2R7Y0B8_9ARCH|nr:MAG: hypothetical protein B9J98_08355 [Candidatus Terraquivivens tikiterensis]